MWRKKTATAQNEALRERLDRWLFWGGLGALVLVWALIVYLPDRRRLARADARRAVLARQIQALWYDAVRLSKGERGLRRHDAYLWHRVIRKRLNWTAPEEQVVREEGESDVR